MGDVMWDGTRWVPVEQAGAFPGQAGNPVERLRALDWRQFEALVAEAYRRSGFEVTSTQNGADGGIDLVITRGGERWFVQCKHWKKWKVGAPVVREMKGLVVHHGASGGIIVTSGRFSDDAYAFARESGIQLVGGPATVELVMGSRLPSAGLLGGTARPGAATAAPQIGPPGCPVCASPMRLQQAGRGSHKGDSFWGCPRYPSCRGIVPVQGWAAPVPIPAAGPTPAPAVARHQPAAPRRGLPAPATRPAAAGPRSGSGGPAPARSSRGRSASRRLGAALLRLAIGLAALWLFVTVVPGLLTRALTPSASPRPAGTSSSRPVATPRAPATPTPSARSTPARPGTVGVGLQPMGIAIDADGGRGYTANFDSGDISVIDLASMTVIQTLDAPGRPSAVAVDAARGVLWVTDYNDARVHALDLGSGKTIATFTVSDEPDHLAVDPAGNRLYVTCRSDDDILVFDTRRAKRLANIEGSRAGALGFDPEAGKVYVAARTSGAVYTYHPESAGWERIVNTFAPDVEFAIDGDRGRLYAVGPAVWEHNLVTGKSRKLEGTGVDAVALDAVGRTAYLVDTEDNTVIRQSVG